MEFRVNCQMDELDLDVSFVNPVILLGSCFSDEMDTHFNQSGFNVLSNPFGTIYHPIALSNVIKRSIDNDKKVDRVNREDLYFSWDSASAIHAYTREELVEKVIDARKSFRNCLESSSLIVLTFGTAWAYHLKKNKEIVANCHKQSLALFDKELSSVEEMTSAWQDTIRQIKHVNPRIKIVLTVSPVRHIRDGLVENNQSKARLIELTHTLSNTDGVTYFPSYEIVIDELRDYRFFGKDLVHPNQLAIEYVWSKFQNFIFSKGTRERMELVRKLKAEMSHRPLYKDSRSNQERIQLLEKRRADLDKKLEGINWE